MTDVRRDGLGLALDDISRSTGETVEELCRWRQLGLFGDGDTLTIEDLERARLVGFAARRGVSPDELARISGEQGDLLAPFVRWALRPGRELSLTRDEAAEQAGIERDVLDRVWTASGWRDQAHAYQEDVDALRLVKLALELGLPLDALLPILRVLGDASAKVAETMTRVFHRYVHEGFRAEGRTGEGLLAATQSMADPMAELVEPAVMYFHRKSWERANRDDLLVHLLEEATPPSQAGQLYRAVLFVDLSSFTSLTEAMGDAAAAGIVERFSDMVRHTAADHDGQVIKQIGDEFMLVFPSSAAAVAFGVGIRAAIAAEPRFPAVRVGAHAGSVLYREGDYLGGNVNLAARVTATAARNQFVVTDTVRIDGQRDDVEFVALGARPLKGISEPVELYEVRTGDEPGAKQIDPVCGMALDEDAADASLERDGQRLLFCSERCLRLFLERSHHRGEVPPAPMN